MRSRVLKFIKELLKKYIFKLDLYTDIVFNNVIPAKVRIIEIEVMALNF